MKRKKRVKISIRLGDVIAAVSKLGNKVNELDKDGQWRSVNSLWARIAAHLTNKLSIDDTLGIQKYIYTMWHRKSSKLRCHFIKDPVYDEVPSNLQVLSSLPSYTKICTRARPTKKNSSNTTIINKPQKYLIELTYEEWRNIYKKGNTPSDKHHMDPTWTDVMYNKLVAAKLVTCSLIFTKGTLRKRFSRKYKTSLFSCHARCQRYPKCTLMVHIKMINPDAAGNDIQFRVEIEGNINHDDPSVSVGRPLKGIKRKRMAEEAMERGILKTYEDNLLNADENLLKCKNYTNVPSTDVIKTAIKELKEGLRLDSDMLVELNMMLFSMRALDEASHIVNKGFIQVQQIWPFATIFHTELQLRRLINYCLSIKDSCIYLDATGSVVKALPNQRKPYLYLICLKDGQDSSNLIPIAGALLTDHSASSITSWLLVVRRAIAATKGHFVRPSNIVIDFSPALLNSILLSFNHMNIQSYLRWCYNVIQKNYTSEQLHFVTCIRFCCAHVMHAFTRSLSKIKMDKNIRRKVAMVFAILLNCNELQQMYELIGCVIYIFGSFDLDNAEEYLDKVIQAGGEINTQFEPYLEDEDITETQRSVEEQLAELDNNFLSSLPILHQSPFTQLARERSPALSGLIDKSKKINQAEIKNQLYSKELIKLYYKWIAYLPIFSGLMYQFQERYASDLTYNVNSKIFGCGRLSNAPIESFFKILKHSILRHQTNLRPGDFLLKIHSTISARLKANEHNIQQRGAKKRGRSTKKELDTTAVYENWKKQGTQITSRGVYFHKLNEPGLTVREIRNRLQEKLELRQHQSMGYYDIENIALAPTTDKPCEECDSCIEGVETQNIIKSVRKLNRDTELVSPIHDLTQAMKTASPIHDLTQAMKTASPIHDLNQAVKITSPVQELNQNAELILPIIHHQTQEHNSTDSKLLELLSVSESDVEIDESEQTTSKSHNIQNSKYVQEFTIPVGWPTHTMVGNLRLPFPHYNIAPTFFQGKRYSASYTCSLDSSLFLLYYIYMSNSEKFRLLFDPKILVCEQLLKTFELVQSEGWDIARLYWISIHSTHPDRNNKNQHHDLYTTADNNVIRYVRELQKYAINSTCTSSTCPKLFRVRYSVDIAMPPLTNRSCRTMIVTTFSEQCYTLCRETIGPDEPISYDGSYVKDDRFPTKDGTNIRTMFVCDSIRTAEPNQFINKPPMIFMNVGQIESCTTPNEKIIPLVKHLPYVLVFNGERYRLAGAICPHTGHFTATIVRAKGRYSKYDDRWKVGVKDNEGGDDFVETAVYVIEMNS